MKRGTSDIEVVSTALLEKKINQIENKLVQRRASIGLMKSFGDPQCKRMVETIRGIDFKISNNDALERWAANHELSEDGDDE